MWPRDNQAELLSYYGDPDINDDGYPEAKWEVVNLVFIPCPWIARTAWAPHNVYSRGIKIHKKCSASLARILDDIWHHFGKDQHEIEKIGLDLIGGTYLFRAKRGSTNLSCHAYGCAIDLDPEHNKMRTKGIMHPYVVQAFKKEGWEWGGDWTSSKDPMHFQATMPRVVAAPDMPKVTAIPAAKPVVVPVDAPKPPKSRVNSRCLDLIKRWEGFRADPYMDAKLLAIGYGHTFAIGTPEVKPGMKVTETEATLILLADLERMRVKMDPLIKVTLNDNQYGALLSFCYNLGVGNLAKSTLLKKINAGDFEGASKQFLVWNRSGGKVLPGLTRRREAESALFTLAA